MNSTIKIWGDVIFPKLILAYVLNVRYVDQDTALKEVISYLHVVHYLWFYLSLLNRVQHSQQIQEAQQLIVIYSNWKYVQYESDTWFKQNELEILSQTNTLGVCIYTPNSHLRPTQVLKTATSTNHMAVLLKGHSHLNFKMNKGYY